MRFFQKSESVNFQVNPLTYQPGGIQLTILFSDGTYEITHNKIKYPKQYTLTLVDKYSHTKNPVIKVYHQSGIIYEKNKS